MSRSTTIHRLVLAAVAALLLAGCGDSDPGAIGPTGVDGGISAEGQRQEYVDGVQRALAQLGSATQTPAFARAVDSGNRRQLQSAAIAWRQGMEQLKGLNPPEQAVEGHNQLLTAVESLDSWNQRIVNAAPNTKRTKALARQASESPASRAFEASVCTLVDAGFEVVDPGACTPLANAAGPVG